MNIANKFTLSRFVMAFALIALFSLSYFPHDYAKTWSVGFNWIDLACCILFILASITDMIDGKLARGLNLITDFGKFMDPLADKFLVNCSFILLCTRTDSNGHFYIFPVFVVLFIGRDLAIDGLRLMASNKGKVLAANIFGKIKTVLEMVTIPIVFLNGFPFSLINLENAYIFTNILTSIALLASLVSGIIYFVQNREFISEM